MIKTAIGLAVATLLGFVPLSGAQAAPVTWAYTGIVSIESGSVFTLGQTVTGTFVFDNATPLSSGPANYAGAVRSFSIDGLPSATLNSTDAGIDNNEIQIRDGQTVGATVIRDNFTAILEMLVDSSPAIDLDKSFVLVLDERNNPTLGETDPPCIETLALPTAPYSPVTCFGTTRTLVARNTTTTNAAERFTFTLVLTDITQVLQIPLPGTWILVGAGLAGLALVRRKP